jgi:hypothetical protein
MPPGQLLKDDAVAVAVVVLSVAEVDCKDYKTKVFQGTVGCRSEHR